MPLRSPLAVLSRLVRLAFATTLIAPIGCHTVPEGRSAVDDVVVRGARRVREGEIRDKIATTASPKFLGVFQGVVYDYSVFDRNVLQRDLARVEAIYRSKGYYDAHVRAGRVHWANDRHVRVEIVVDEGPPVVVKSVQVEGLDGLPDDVVRAAHRVADRTLELGAPFEEEAYDASLGAVRRALTDRGYAYAKVERDATVDVVRRRADVVLTASPGPRCVFGPVTIEGLGGLPEAPVRRAVDITTGAPYSEAALDAAQQAVLDLGVFASVDVRPDLSRPPSRENDAVPITVKVEPARLRTVRLGGGVEFDALKADVHGVVGWEDRNFLGGLRTFKVSFKPGVVFHPLRFNNIVAPERLLPEGRLRLDLRQPGFLEARSNAFVRPEVNVQALLYDTNPPPDAPVIGYGELKNAIGIDRTISKLYAAISHNVHAAYPFAYVGRRDPTLGTLLISYPQLVTQLDFRDDRVHPRRGLWIGNRLEVAGGPFGGDADDVKVQPDVRGYIPVARGVVLALRGSVGLLFPRNYGDHVRASRSVFDSTAPRTRDYQLTFFRGLFSGGPTSNRGYPLRGIGPHAIVPFISPAIEEQRLSTACGGEYDCRTPTGGFTLWEASAEVRFAVTGPLSVATFCDASDVSPRVADFRFDHLHLSCGAGGRYDTPVGPVRLDVGYRIPELQVIGGLTPDERAPQTFPLGIPIAVSVGIGEAF